jgi:AcrR family transcriptional regulator
MESVKRKRADGRETMARILDFAIDELRESGPVHFNLDRVIENSGASRSSVYLHFGNRDGLIAASEIREFTDLMMVGVEEVRKVLLAVASMDEWLVGYDEVLRHDNDAIARERRVRRVSTFIAASNNPKLWEQLAQVQKDCTRHIAVTFDMAVERGLMHPTAPTLGIAYLVQSMLVGRILLDFDENPEANDAWVDAAMSSLRHLLNGQMASESGNL